MCHEDYHTHLFFLFWGGLLPTILIFCIDRWVSNNLNANWLLIRINFIELILDEMYTIVNRVSPFAKKRSSCHSMKKRSRYPSLQVYKQAATGNLQVDLQVPAFWLL